MRENRWILLLSQWTEQVVAARTSGIYFLCEFSLNFEYKHICGFGILKHGK